MKIDIISMIKCDYISDQEKQIPNDSLLISSLERMQSAYNSEYLSI